MTFSVYSAIMSYVWFTVALFVGSYLIMKKRRVSRGLILFVLMLGLIRLVFPVELRATQEVQEWNIYPFFQNLWKKEVINEITIATIAIAIWGIGSILQFIQFISNVHKVNQMISRGKEISKEAEQYEICSKVLAQFNYKRKTKVMVTSELSIPVSVGVFYPIILIPTEVMDFNKIEFEGIFRHELIHHLHKDVAIQRGVILLQCVFWWNPIIYYLKKSVERIIELRCDARACKSIDERERIAYLQGIVNVLKGSKRKSVKVGVGYVKDNSGAFLQRRFREILEPVKPLSYRTAFILVSVCMIIFILSYSFVIQPAGYPSKKELYEQGATFKPEIGEEAEQDFLLQLSDGTYMYIQGMIEKDVLTEREIKQPMYAELPIYK